MLQTGPVMLIIHQLMRGGHHQTLKASCFVVVQVIFHWKWQKLECQKLSSVVGDCYQENWGFLMVCEACQG